MIKRAIIAGGLFSVIVLGALAVAVAGAQSNEPTATAVPSATPTDGSTAVPGGDETYNDFFLSDLASRLGISVDALKGNIADSEKALIDKALADGKINQTQADDLKARVDAGEKIYFRFMFGGPHGGMRGIINNIVDEAAKVLGIDSSEVKDGLKAGTSLQDIASAHGMSADAFKSALLAQAKSDLDAKVADGTITQDKADEIYQHFSDNIDNIVTDTRGDFGGPFGPGRGHRGPGPGFFFGGPDDDDNSPSASPSTSSGTGTSF
jgi:uncharacterized protein YidB (DUF937 family)